MLSSQNTGFKNVVAWLNLITGQTLFPPLILRYYEDETVNTALDLLVEQPLLLTSACRNPAQAFGRADRVDPRHCLLGLKHLSLAKTSPCLFRTVISQWKTPQLYRWVSLKDALESTGSGTQRWFRQGENGIAQHTTKQEFSQCYNWRRLWFTQGYLFPGTAGPSEAEQHRAPGTGFRAQY